MRGAMLIDAISGRRLEADQSRGVRVSRMDADPAASEAIDLLLNGQSLANPRVLEAWILASKVALYPQIVAELCWSDDPDYLTGYVASAQFGYQRITHLKEAGSQIGGRIFFVQTGSDLGALVTKLQSEPVLFSSPMTEFP
jgi:6-carboxyhexanoate--CoA ligase